MKINDIIYEFPSKTWFWIGICSMLWQTDARGSADIIYLIRSIDRSYNNNSNNDNDSKTTIYKAQ